MEKFIKNITAAILSVLMISATAWATDYYWIGSPNGNWNDINNWKLANNEIATTFPNDKQAKAIFDSPENTEVIITGDNTNISIGEIESKAGNLIISSNSTKNTLKLYGDIKGKTITFGCKVENYAQKITCNNLIFNINSELSLKENLFINAYVLFNGKAISASDKKITLTMSDDFIINSSSYISLDPTLSISGSFVSFGANITIENNITIQKDLVLYGKDYDATELQSKTPNINAYRNGNFIKTVLPDGTPLPLTGSEGTLYIANKKITVFENFYANGITISNGNLGSIGLSKNINTKTFAKVYNSNIKKLTFNRNTNKDDIRVVVENSSTDNDSNLITDNFEIEAAYTVSDDILCIKFNRPLKNLDGCFSKNISQLFHSDGNFISVYSDKNCKEDLKSDDTQTIVYIKSSSKWNTDTTGNIASLKKDSTDKNGIHRSTVPFIGFNRGSDNAEYITDVYGKTLKHYFNDPNSDSEYKIYTDVTDNCSPALISVKTGQECHTSENQKPYDAHNFIEFRYSEPVKLGTVTQENNIQVTSNMGVISNNPNGGFNVAGICSIQSGKVETGAQGKSDDKVNALYRDFNDPYAIKLSIAGFWDEKSKKWPGYIENAIQPSGYVTVDSSHQLIIDSSDNPQSQISNYSLTVDSSTNGIYGNWDIASPVFAEFSHNKNSANKTYEITGVTSGTGSTIERVEFHLFDNSSMENAVWISELGWCKSSNSPYQLYKSNTQCMDNFGGSRPFATSNATSGGIRSSTIDDSIEAFSFFVDDSKESHKFTQRLKTNITSSLFTGSSNTGTNPVPQEDSPYFSLGINEKDISLSKKLSVSYDENKGYVTDLAGNRLKSAVNICNTDRNPPAFNIALAPVNQKNVFLTFTKKLNTKNLSTIKDSLQIVSKNGNQLIPSQELKIESIEEVNKSTGFTSLKLTLNKDLTLWDIKNSFIQVKEVIPSKDPFTGIENCYVTNITDFSNNDEIKNSMQMLSTHAISDFAINVVNPLYAYKTNLTSQDIDFSNAESNSTLAVRNWDKNQKLGSNLPAKQPISIVTNLDDSDTAEEIVKIYLSNNPDSGSLFSKFNQDFSSDLRIWFPKLPNEIKFPAYTSTYNSNYKQLCSEKSDKLSQNQVIFNVETVENWKAGETISFIFELPEQNFCLSPVYDNINHTYDFDSNKVPLFALRLSNPNDITSLDLWSFNLKETAEQRGGVTILNNVINTSKGDVAILKVNLPSDAKRLNIIVMTMDGNIIKYLNRGETKAGEYNFTWNGKNEKGNTVARGLYFIRISGDNIDETRKVMCIK